MSPLPRARTLPLCLLLAAAFPAVLPAQSKPAANPGAGAADSRRARIVSSRKPWVVTYDHLRETMELRDDEGDERGSFTGEALADGPMLRIPPDRPVEVRIVNANPMLYDYDVSATVVQERRARGCRAVLGTFAQAGLQFRALSLGEVPARWSVDTAIKTLVSAEALAARGGAIATRGEPMSPADRARTIALVAERVQQFEARARAVTFTAASIEDSLAAIAELADATEAGPLLDSLAAAIRRQIPGATRATDVALAIRNLASEAAQPATVLMQLTAHGESDVRDVRTRFDSALTAIARGYRSLQGQLYRIERYRAQVEQRYTLEPSGDYRAIRIRLEPTREFPAVARFRSGTVEAITNPTGTISCNLAPGLALTGTPRAYALRNDSIVQSSSGEQRTAGALLLHLDAPSFPLPVGALAGIGLGSNKRPDWYLGGSVRVSDVVRLNAGAIWQREERLPSGQRVGTTVPQTGRAAFDERPKGYTAGFFWGISLVP